MIHKKHFGYKKFAFIYWDTWLPLSVLWTSIRHLNLHIYIYVRLLTASDNDFLPILPQPITWIYNDVLSRRPFQTNLKLKKKTAELLNQNTNVFLITKAFVRMPSEKFRPFRLPRHVLYVIENYYWLTCALKFVISESSYFVRAQKFNLTK